ncbi:MAG: biotin/lipoyl-containing protein [Lachnospirales bacterium]
MKKIYNIKVNGKVYEVELEEVKEVAGSVVSDSPKAASTVDTVSSASTSVGGTEITAPMPGSIFDIKVSVGDTVQEGDVVAVLEAMKMETEIFSSCSGKVTSIVSDKGTQVTLGDVILTIN